VGDQRARRAKSDPPVGAGSLGMVDGSVEVDAVGAAGSVGVGTGGKVSGGHGSRDASVGSADGVPVGAVPGAAGAETRPETVTTAAADDGGTTDEAGTGAAGEAATAAACFTGWAGASPMPPEPPGASTADDRVAGVASCQPIETATGKPRATSPKKMDLGDNRT
jgi:hypothetical protein